MRTTLLFISAIAILISSCSTGNKMESSANKGDDLYVTQTETAPPSLSDTYSNPSDEEYQNDQSNPSPDYTTSDKYTDENGTTYVTNNYYEGQNYDFYGSDYSYSSELSKWYGPSVGFGYYSPFYTSPGFGISLSFGIGWGSSWYNPYYPWYNPYYSWYSPYYYNPWYYPYYYGYNPYYYPYYGGGYYGGGYCGGGYYGDGYGYGSNTYYGPHGSSSSNTSGNGDGRQYKYENDNGSEFNSTDNIPVLAEKPRTALAISGNETNDADIKTPTKRNPIIVNGNSSNNEVENIKSNPGRNLSTPANPSEIKSNVPPVRSNPPSNQHIENSRPRTSAQAPMFEQQRNSNTVANAVNKQMSSQNDGYAEVASKTRVAQEIGGVKYDKEVVTNPSRSTPNYKISKPQTEKHPAFSKEQPVKSQPSKTNINNDRPSNNSNNAATRSYNQSNNAHSSSSGNTRSSNSTRRK